MSFTPEPPDGPSLPAAGARSRRNPVLVGVLVGVLVFVVAAGGFVGLRAASGGKDDGPTTATTPRADASSPSTSASASPSAPHPSTDPNLAEFYHQKLAWHACGRD